ncbi:hypothetical protein CN151_23220 [Sinorhizobium meliloti]|nr:hypothetical protein CN151_23220 [Sinorhizobium meliloti]RVM89569.1 hypothetical protein CN119_25330 [Sinorhizobium meliloti]RVN00419.1 hypothetical protein CN112_33265 [Sinorhizobium meliloti]
MVATACDAAPNWQIPDRTSSNYLTNTDMQAMLGTVRNSVRWAMMMKRRESSHGYRERTSGPAPGWT